MVSWLTRFVVSSVGIVFALLGYAGCAPNALIAAMSLVVTIVFCFHVRKNRLLLLISIICVYLCYSLFFVNYASPLTTTLYTAYRETNSAGVALAALLLFFSCLVVFLPSEIHEFGKGSDLFSSHSGNPVIVYIVLIILGLVLVYGFGRPDAIGSDRGTPTPIYEYSAIFFLIGFYIAGNHNGLKRVLILLAVLYALQNIVYGGRIMALQIILVVYFCVFSQKTSDRTFNTLIVVGLLLFTFLGSVRTGLVGAGLNDIVNAWSSSIARGFAWDTAYSSWHTSITFVLYEDMISFAERLSLLWQWIQSVFFGGNIAMSSLPVVTHDYFFHSYGGVLPVYFQFYLGPLGVVLIAAYTSLIVSLVNWVCEEKEGICGAVFGSSLAICAIFISASCFRWILYSPSQLTRGLMFCFLFSVVALWLDKQMTRQGHRRVLNKTDRRA